MISVMSTKFESSDQNEVARDGPAEYFEPIDRDESSRGFGCYSEWPSEESARVSRENDDVLCDARVSNAMITTSVSELKNEEAVFGDESAEAFDIHPSSSLSQMRTSSKNMDARKSILGNTEDGSIVNYFNSMSSSFDEFAQKDKRGAIGHGYEIGDMVWAKVKSHPWWPGHIYNEEYASSSVRKSKREGHALVAFFGDSSYGWFLSAELIPFEQNFAEKSHQTNLKSFVNAVEEAVDELSRRRSLGLACRCRNEFNFWPSGYENYFVVDVGDSDPGIYSFNQIKKARDSFQPRKLLSFIQRLALTPRNHLDWTIDLIKNKATVLACRKSLFEEFDETYAQAFGTTAARLPRPTSPMVVDPTKASLSGRLLIAEVLSKGETYAKPAKHKNQLEKNNYHFKRRDEASPKKAKKSTSGQAGLSNQPLLVDGSEFSGRGLHSDIGDTIPQNQESSSIDDRNQPSSHLTSMANDNKHPEFSGKLTVSASKKGAFKKRPAVKLSSDHVVFIENKNKKVKKELKNDVTANIEEFPITLRNNGVPIENVLGTDSSSQDSYHFDRQKVSVINMGSTSFNVETQQGADIENFELPVFLRDLRLLALNPFHGSHRSCFEKVRPVFLNFRSLVYQKSLILVPTDSEASETRTTKPLPVNSNVIGPIDGTSDMSMKKPVKLAPRLDESMKSGIKRPPLDHVKGVKRKKMTLDSEDIKNYNHVEDIRKKKIRDPEGMKRKKAMEDLDDTTKKKTNESEDIKKVKKIDDWKSPAPFKKPFQRSIELQKVDGKECSAKNDFPVPPKLGRQESYKKSEHSAKTPHPTMLVMKFPSGAGLPSGPELRARFARFGPMDHSATRVFWKSYTCRVVYRYMADAQAALKFTENNSNVFGNVNVRCYLRDLSAEAVESESTQIQNDGSSLISTPQPRDSAVDQRGITAQLLQQSVQLKSCLKKPTSDEGGNGGARGTRVKFVLEGQESSASEHPFSGNKNIIASYPEGASSSSFALDDNSKIFSKFIPHSSIPPMSSSTLHKLPINTSSSEQGVRLYLLSGTQMVPSEQISKDVSLEMLNLLNKCSDVVKNLTSVLGYMPYHPL